jgi:hypothetical protein
MENGVKPTSPMNSGVGSKAYFQNVEFWSKGSEVIVTWGVIDTTEFKCKLDADNTGGI